MNIAIIAHDKKKSLMTDLCTKYAGVLSEHMLYCTGTTGKILENLGLKVKKLLAGRQGGDDQISARIAYDEIDILLFFRDNVSGSFVDPHDSILYLCDIHNIILATNLATAEVILEALKNGNINKQNM